MLYALGKVDKPRFFISPERIAKTDPFKQFEKCVGSGPMKRARSEWKPGASAVFEKFKDCPRARRRAPTHDPERRRAEPDQSAQRLPLPQALSLWVR